MFRTISYIVVDLIGAEFTSYVIDTWTGAFTMVVNLAILTLRFALIGEFFLDKVSIVYRRVLFIFLFKLFDSLLGAGFAIVSTKIIAYLSSVFLIAKPLRISEEYIVG